MHEEFAREAPQQPENRNGKALFEFGAFRNYLSNLVIWQQKVLLEANIFSITNAFYGKAGEYCSAMQILI